VTVVEVAHRRPTPRGRGRLVLADGHGDASWFSSLVGGVAVGLQPGVEQLDLVALGDRDDGALGVGALADDQPAALALAGRFIVFTLSTFTSKMRSIACLISVLLARGSTTNVYLFSSSRP
jgi:hypothetical protein